LLSSGNLHALLDLEIDLEWFLVSNDIVNDSELEENPRQQPRTQVFSFGKAVKKSPGKMTGLDSDDETFDDA
jgi:hypothetical protein